MKRLAIPAIALLLAGSPAWADKDKGADKSLALTVASCPGTAATGGAVTYAYQVQNTGDSKIEKSKLKLTVTLDPQLLFSSYSGSHWTCSVSAGPTVSCTYGIKLNWKKYASPLVVTALTPSTAASITTSAVASTDDATSKTVDCTSSVTITSPSLFDAVDKSGSCSSTALNTKVVNTPFELQVKVTNDNAGFNPSSVATYLVDASSFGYPPYAEGSNNCPKGLSLDNNNRPRSYIASATVPLSAKQGTFSTTGIGSVYRNLLVFMVDTAKKTNYACSTDNFAVRPDHFNVGAWDADWRTPGLYRALTNTASRGGVHAAGRPFSVRAQATDAANRYSGWGYSSLGTDYFYDAANSVGLRPRLAVNGVLQPVGGVAGTVEGNFNRTLGSGSGIVVADNVTYDEVGAFNLLVYDDDFAAVDQRNTCSTQADRRISGTTNVGRFIPDALTVTAINTPQFKTFNADDTACPSRSFTYVGQPFGYATPPAFLVKGWSYDAEEPEATENYRGDGRLSWAHWTTELKATYSSSSATLDTTKVTAPTITDSTGGAIVSVNASDTLSFNRSSTAIAPFAAAIRLDLPVMDCADQYGIGQSNSCIPICFDAANSYSSKASSCTSPTSATVTFNGSGSGIAFDAGNAFRYGYLALPATASVPNPNTGITLSLDAKYWNGTGWQTNTLDNCTDVPANSFTLSGYPSTLPLCSTLVSVGSKITAGSAAVTLSAPGTGRKGSVAVSPNLGATATGNTATAPCSASSPTAATPANLPWLQCTTGFLSNCTGNNPATTATFNGTSQAVNKVRPIYTREVF